MINSAFCGEEDVQKIKFYRIFGMLLQKYRIKIKYKKVGAFVFRSSEELSKNPQLKFKSIHLNCKSGPEDYLLLNPSKKFLEESSFLDFYRSLKDVGILDVTLWSFIF